MYEAVVLIHVLSGIAWVGGGMMLLVTLRDVRVKDGDDAAAQTVARVERAGPWLYNLAPWLVVVTGIAMVIVSSAWEFSQGWVYSALGLFVATGVFGGQLDKQMKALKTGQGQVTPSGLARLQRLFSIEMGILLSLVALMVLKPGV
jgi:uncharacterized membrane protein